MKSTPQNFETPVGPIDVRATDGVGQARKTEEGGPRLRGVGVSAALKAHGRGAAAVQEDGSKWATLTVLPEGVAT
jgi:hypothetical protein